MINSKVSIPAFIDKSNITGDAPHVVTMNVTPQIAEHWLKSNLNNRRLSKPHVLFLTQQMKDGTWSELNGDTIRFDIKGNLLDGQHRLSAVIKSGKTFKFLVVFGLPAEYFKTMDTGKPRGAADVLGIEGYKYAGIAAATAKFMLRWEKQLRASAVASSSTKTTIIKTTNQLISDFAKKNKAKLVKHVNTAAHYQSIGDRLISPTWTACLLWLFSEKDEREAESFMYRLSTGANVDYKSLLFQLRKKLIEAKASQNKRLTAMAQFAYIIKVWNANRTGKDLKILSYRPASGEAFPTII